MDRRYIYLLVILALSVPLLTGYRVPPARMAAAEALYETIDELQVAPGEIAFVALDITPSTKAENEPQSEVLLEHLMRRRIPVALFSLSFQAEPFLVALPDRVAQRLMREHPGETWRYGTDWVNLGFRPGAGTLIQAIPKSGNLVELFGKDAWGNDLRNVPAFAGVRTVRQIKLLAEVTGLIGAFDLYVAFFQAGEYKPVFVHGCTSITIPNTFIYMDSGQLQGLLEGIAGAAWYSELLQRSHPGRIPDASGTINTALGIAHLIVILLVVIGNVAAFRRTAK